MKKLLIITLTVAMLLSMLCLNTLSVTAQTEELGSLEFYTVDGNIVSLDGQNYDMTVAVFGRNICPNTINTIENIIELGLDRQTNTQVVFIDCDKNSKEAIAKMAENYVDSNVAFCYDTTDKASNALWSYLYYYGEYSNSITLPLIAFIEKQGVVSKVTTGLLEKNILKQFVNGDFSADEVVSFNVVGDEDYDYAYSVLESMNQLRNSLGLTELTMDKDLLEAAMQRAAEIGIFYSHTRPNESMFTGAISSDYPVYMCSMGENIATGQRSPASVMQSWTDSPGHYANMTNANYSSVGIGCYFTSNGKPCWVQVFSSGEANEVQKSGRTTVERTIDAKLKLLDLRLLVQSDLHALKKGDKSSLKIININREWSNAQQIIEPSAFEFISSNSNIAIILPDGTVEITGEGDLKITAVLNQCPAMSLEYEERIGHIYDNFCDTTCNMCNERRSITHTYDNACDAICNICEYKRTVPAHVYDNFCDTACNECGKTRTITHNYKWVIDKKENCGVNGAKHEECSVCGAKRNTDTVINATGKHSYDNSCDTACNVCGKTRTITHNYKWVIDKKANCMESGLKHEECSICGIKQNENTVIEATGNHIYTHQADKYCDICDAEREVTGQHLIEEDGVTYYYLDGEKTDITDLVKIDGVWYYISNGVWDTSIDTLHKINGKWFLIKGGIWKAITGLEEYKGKTFYVVGGKWNSDVTDLKNVDGKWYYIQYGKWNKSIDTLHKINGKWFLIKKGMWNKTTGLVDYQGKTFLVKGGKWDSSVNTLYKKGTKLYAIKSGKVYTSKTVISYNGKKYYCNKGYAQTSFSGKVKIGSKTYTVKKGIVK